VRPTQKDIAKLAQVSQATVSLVLNGISDSSVPQVTQRKVLRAAKTLGYVPNRVAQSLRTQQTKTIACIVPDITNPFYPALERGAQKSAESNGYDVLIYNTDGLPAKERKCLDRLLEGRVDGVIGVFFHVNARDLRPLLERNIAVVRIEANPKKTGPWPLDNLYVDNAEGAKAGTEYLIELGHRRIAMIAGRPHVATTFERVNAYKRTLRSHGLTIDDTLIHDGSEEAESFHRLLALKLPPTAILAGNNRSMMRLMQYVHTTGLRVPRDIAVVGFDDFEWADYFHPRLTVIAQPIEAIAKRAVSLLAACIEAPDTKRQTIHIKPKLVIRESCGSAR